MQLQVGQSAAALVKLPRTDGHNWMVCTVRAYDPTERTYVVADILEDEELRRHIEYTVAEDRVVQFPQPRARFQAGDRVRTVWYEASTQGWTSILYPATVIAPYPCPTDPTNLVLKVRYDGDPKVTYIHAQWAINGPDLDVSSSTSSGLADEDGQEAAAPAVGEGDAVRTAPAAEAAEVAEASPGEGSEPAAAAVSKEEVGPTS